MSPLTGPEGVWKFTTGILATALVTLTFAYPRDIVSRADFEQFKREEIDHIEQVRREQAEKDARLEERVRQLQIDSGRIAEKLGVPAHPGDSR
jgi:hypothetical protein